MLASHLKRVDGPGRDDPRLSNLRKIVLGELKAGSVLDIGCGTGHFAIAALRDGHAVTAADIDNGLVRLARKGIEANGYKAKVIRADMARLSALRVGRFDNIVALDVLEHVEDDVDALHSAGKLLKENGRIIVCVPAHQSLYSERDKRLGHFRRYGEREFVEKASRAGFSVKKMRHWNATMLPISALNKLFGRSNLEEMRYGDSLPSRLAKRLAGRVLSIEERVAVPFGISIIAVLEKKEDATFSKPG